MLQEGLCQLKSNFVHVCFFKQDVLGCAELREFAVQRQTGVRQEILKIRLPQKKQRLNDSLLT